MHYQNRYALPKIAMCSLLKEVIMPEVIVGSVPRGEDYFGREVLIENLWSRLAHDNILLEAPRRFGKTGAMYRLLDEPRESFQPLYMNVEHIMTAADFMVEFMALLLRDHRFSRVLNTLCEGTVELVHSLCDSLRNLPSSIDLGKLKVVLRESTDVPQEWDKYGEKVMSLLAGDGPPLLLLIDEFAIMVNAIAQRNRDDVNKLLRWFRAARTAPDTQTRFVIGGSVNLRSTLDSLGLLDTVNDFWIERLKPFDSGTARQYIESVFSSRGVEPGAEVTDTILDQVGTPIPCLLAVMVTAIFDRQRATRSPVTAEMVKAAFDNDLLGGATSLTFQHYRSRIGEYYPGLEGKAAKAILGVLSKSEHPMRRATLYQIFLETGNLQPNQETKEDFVQLMHKLDNDFYIVTEDRSHTFTFFSRALQLWWKTHYGFQGE